MSVTRRALAPLLLLSMTAALAACGGGDDPAPDAAATTAPAAASPSAEPTPSPTPEPEVLSLTQEQVDAALLTADDLGDGWIVDTVSGMDLLGDDTDDDDRTVEPPECSALMEAMEGMADDEPTATGVVQLAAESAPQVVAQRIETIADTDVAELAGIEGVISACPTVRETAADGAVLEMALETFDVPQVGDGAVGVAASTQGLTLHFVFVAVGDQHVTLAALGLDPAAIGELASTAVDRIESAA
ncbi:hypothetical protein [Cellulomonas gilvus]|uniref:Lipoprotein n=1 Tax=Cellulomonas gilvus (strain ATCC 13127 / NRRL B-14078) TaxID=593907 RepID=F8A3Y2_CELGA|nr:hypothetical protein [Cellulomonas gilvus]AEI13174.1 lipoprotein [Cellulomonas gilvus ATCC 13127]